MVHGGCNTSPSSLSSSCRYCTRCGDCFFTEFLPRPVPASTVLSFARTAEGNGKKSVDINRDLSPPPPPLPHRKLTEPIDTVMCPGGHAAHSMKHVRAGEPTHCSRHKLFHSPPLMLVTPPASLPPQGVKKQTSLQVHETERAVTALPAVQTCACIM